MPDLRYVPVGDPQTTANWLFPQLIAGPRPDLQNAETNLEFPAGLDASKPPPVIVGNSVTRIDVPGAGSLSPSHRNRLAAQLATTLDQVLSGGPMAIVDNGHAVLVPAVGGAEFSATDFVSALGAPAPTAAVYYVRDGAVYDGDGHPLEGLLGDRANGFDTVALARLNDAGPLYVAGTTPSGGAERLVVGTEETGLHRTSVLGTLTRASWTPGLDEAWVSTGTKLYRVTSTGRVTAVPLSGVPADAQVTALRMSPDASRIAMVVTEKGTAQAYVATVARSGTDVRVVAATPITPAGVQVNDVAWNDPQKLFLIGTLTTGESDLVEVQADGSLWTAHVINDLPASPKTITVTQNQLAWVSAGGAVWKQSGSTWVSPTAASYTTGDAPVYLE